jgi:hypothetical protein
MSHVTGPGHVLVSLRFGKQPVAGPWITLRASIDAPVEPMLDVKAYVQEVLIGVADANEAHGTHLEVEEIEIVPDDAPTKGQVRYCARKLTEFKSTGEQSTPPNA